MKNIRNEEIYKTVNDFRQFIAQGGKVNPKDVQRVGENFEKIAEAMMGVKTGQNEKVSQIVQI